MRKVFYFILSAIVFTSIFVSFLNFKLKNSPWGIYKKLHQILLENTKYAVWVIGSSRAETAYETNILSKNTHLSWFNAGIHGAKPQQTYYILKQIFVQHPAPRYIIFDIDIHNLETKDSLLNIEQFAPFFNNKGLRKDFSKIDKRVEMVYYNPLYEISFYGLRGIAKFIRILADMPGRYDTTFQNTGCYHSHTNFIQEHYSDSTHIFQLNTFNLNFIDSIINLCAYHHTKLIFTISPIYHCDKNIKTSIQNLKKIYNDKKIQLLDFSYIPDICNDSNKFSDKYHLKYNGCVEFTNIVKDTVLNIFRYKE